MEENRNKGFWSFLRLWYWELRSHNGQFEYLQFFLWQIPGLLGKSLRRIAYQRYLKKCGSGVNIYSGVRIHNGLGLELGDNVNIAADCALQAGGGIVIGDRTAFGPGCKVWSINHVFDDTERPMLEQGYDYKSVLIGPDVWLAANVFLMPGVELSEGCIVSAGSVVGAKKYPPYSIIAGNPARIIGNRKKVQKAGTEEDQTSTQ